MTPGGPPQRQTWGHANGHVFRLLPHVPRWPPVFLSTHERKAPILILRSRMKQGGTGGDRGPTRGPALVVASGSAPPSLAARHPRPTPPRLTAGVSWPVVTAPRLRPRRHASQENSEAPLSTRKRWRIRRLATWIQAARGMDPTCAVNGSSGKHAGMACDGDACMQGQLTARRKTCWILAYAPAHTKVCDRQTGIKQGGPALARRRARQAESTHAGR